MGKWRTRVWGMGNYAGRFGSADHPIRVGYSPGNTGLWIVNFEYGELQTNGAIDCTQITGYIDKQPVRFWGSAKRSRPG